MKCIRQITALILFLIILCSVSYAAEELCNFIDDDGDGEIDEGLGRGDSCIVGVGECEEEGYIICAENEIDAICNAEPGTPSDEICDQKDNDCDGDVDEGNVCTTQELCNGLDDDGDGEIDEDFRIGMSCYVGRGECRVNGTIICDKNDETDDICNATAGTPSTEICDGLDNDCNGKIDDGLSTTYYEDGDGDGYGGPNKKVLAACNALLRIEILTPSDCDDTNSSIHPGTNDECDGVDNDCDGEIDEDCVQPVPPRQPVELVTRSPLTELNDTEVQNDTGAQNDTGQPSAVTSVLNSIGNAVGNFFGFLGGLFGNKCKGVVCPPSVKVCQDGSEARCMNKCKRGKCSSCAPVCPTIPLVSDADGDGIADAADQCSQDAGLAGNKGCPLNLMVRLPSDLDSDGVDANDDQCPQDAGLASNNGCPFTLTTQRSDSDNDGIIDDADQCPTESGFVTNYGCLSTDIDGDGFDDSNDYCPNVAGTLSVTTQQSNGCPSVTDEDGDGIADDADQCPQDVGLANNKGCSLSLMVRPLSDPDGDGIEGNADLCPEHPGPSKNRGCAFIPLQIQRLDSDDDMVIDDADQCPTQSGFVTNYGCPSTDTDGDGYDDSNDYCPNVAGTFSTRKSQSNGCPSVTDTDGDGIGDDSDQCPNDVGLARNEGCLLMVGEAPASDTDNDGVANSNDLCPQHPGPAKNRGCAFIPLQIQHLDSDNDGTIDDADPCPTESGPVINSGCP